MTICNRNARRIGRCARMDAARDTRNRRGAPETIAEELYNASGNQVTMLQCCDSNGGCREIDARRRSSYWPSFAHPRWLTCAELNSRRPCSRYLR